MTCEKCKFNNDGICDIHDLACYNLKDCEFMEYTNKMKKKMRLY